MNFIYNFEWVVRKKTSYNNFQQLISDQSSWIAFKAFKLDVQPLVEIKGLEEYWVEKDEIYVECDDSITCTDVSFSVVSSEGTSTVSDILKKCQEKGLSYVQNPVMITGTALEGGDNSGFFDFNINLGGYHPFGVQKTELKYTTQKQQITFRKQNSGDSRASVTIDKGTMIFDFFEDLKVINNNNLVTFMGEKTYLCAKVARKDGQEITVVSDKPLKVDFKNPSAGVSEKGSDKWVTYPEPEYIRGK
jgi:hypothetical protein